MPSLLPFALLAVGVLTGAAPLLVRWLGARAGAVLAGGLAVVGAALTPALGQAFAGEPLTYRWSWLPQLGVELALHLDALSAVFVAVVLGVGILVLAYSARYLSPRSASGWLLTLLTAFAGAMLGLVLAADVLLLFVFWELTTVVSFLLIGGRDGNGRKEAFRAFVVTGLGGLALLAGLVLLSQAGGTADLTALIGVSGDGLAGPTVTAATGLIVLAAFTKSAQVPFHFWLPGAMVAPTPVSTYLHAATMVKAGIYVLLRFAPVLGEQPLWDHALLWGGLTTAVVGGVAALRSIDLKALLAGSTVSQLGLITALIGLGSETAMLAAVLHVVAHAAFKSSLFMAVGVVDVATGTRRVDELVGLGRALPVLAVTMGLAGLSMAGVIPMLGFVSKEEAVTAFLEPDAGTLALVVFLVASALTAGYTARMLRVLAGRPRGRSVDLRQRTGLLASAPAVAAAFGLVAGPGVALLDGPIGAATAIATGGPIGEHLALWHGFGAPLTASVLAIAAGVVLGLRFRSSGAGRDVGAAAFDTVYRGMLIAGRWWGRVMAPLAPTRHLLAVLSTAVVVGGAAAFVTRRPSGPLAGSLTEEWIVLAMASMAVLGVVGTLRRLAAVVMLGAVGFLLTIWYVLAGAPDLALTQLLIETLIVVLVVLVFRRLPASFPAVSRRRTWTSAVVAVVGGLGAGLATWALTGRTPLSPAGRYYLENAVEETGGSNVVNTILVDFRGFDTLGEVTVLAAAALGASALVADLRRRRAAPDEEASP